MFKRFLYLIVFASLLLDLFLASPAGTIHTASLFRGNANIAAGNYGSINFEFTLS